MTPGDGVVTRGTLNEYDASGRIVATHRIENLRVLWVENAESGVLEVTEVTDYDVLSSTESFYDAEGRLEYTTDEFGTRTEYFYDVLGRQVETRYQGRRTKAAISNGSSPAPSTILTAAYGSRPIRSSGMRIPRRR